METNQLKRLIEDYKKAPNEFRATRYWRAYEERIFAEIQQTKIEDLRSGKYPIFGTFGFSESVYHYNPNMPFYIKFIKKLIRKFFITGKATLPYSLRLEDIREMAYQFCMANGMLSHSKPVSEIETSKFGNPQDCFSINGKIYTMQFLNFYLRYCYANNYIKLKGDETIVELGTGSCFQVEILKKLYPDLTILCFDLPSPLFLGELYLKNVMPSSTVVGSDHNLQRTDLGNLEKGKIHMFGNWQFPLLKDFKFDIFWNAASFGEMEPDVVKNYLSIIKENFEWVYLLQARKGKESTQNSGVVKPIAFEDYNDLLSGYKLMKESDAYEAHRKMSQSGGYFQAVWSK